MKTVQYNENIEIFIPEHKPAEIWVEISDYSGGFVSISIDEIDLISIMKIIKDNKQ